MSTPRTPDDGRNERQRQRQDEDTRPKRAPDDGRKGKGKGKAEGEDRDRLLDEKPFDYIERTRPEDRLDQTDHPGQQTRDNVNPNIPSVSPEETGPPNARVPNPGGIVDPNTLGMDQSQQGVVPPEPLAQPEQWPSLGLDHTKDGADQVPEAENRQRQAREGSGGLGDPDYLPSINEPPGSIVDPDAVAGGEPPPEPEPEPEDELPENLDGMKRSELDELAEQRGVDISDAGNKDEVIALLRKDERKRRRK